MAIVLRKRKKKNGDISLYLDISNDNSRAYEFLNIYLKNERTKEDRAFNKQQLLLAERIKTKRWTEILNGTFKLEPINKKDVDFFQFAETLITDTTAYHRSYSAILKKLKAFLNKSQLPISKINEQLLRQFYDHME